jgi:hypothetical protein
VRHLHQFPIGSPYSEIASIVGKVVHEGSLGHIPLVVDITAVGSGVLPVLRNAVRPAWLEPVFLTAGGTAGKDEVSKAYRIPKRDLITTMLILLQGGRIKIPATLPNAALLVQELKNFRTNLPISTNPDTLDWRERPHDDLVLATAIACWWGEQHRPYVPGTMMSGETETTLLLKKLFPEQYPITGD